MDRKGIESVGRVMMISPMVGYLSFGRSYKALATLALIISTVHCSNATFSLGHKLELKKICRRKLAVSVL
jgi:hypothetical protein